MKSVQDVKVKGRRVLVRCDFNEPLDDSGALLDDFRIRKSLPTIKYLMDYSVKVILIAHLGDPNGNVVESLRLKVIKHRLEELLNKEIKYARDCIGPEVESTVRSLGDSEVLLLENLRFYAGEEANDENFAKQLAALGELYVNDAFSVCHRTHASIVGVPQFLPSATGMLLEKELEHLEKVRHNPVRPFVVVVGGKKVETKAAFIEKISHVADTVLISNLIKKELSRYAGSGVARQEKHSNILDNVKILGPEENLDALDIDEKTIKIFERHIARAKTVVWNGPAGKFEDEQYRTGTEAIAKAIIESGAFSVVGGGETIEFLHKFGLLDKFSWVSTGGGAMLNYLSGEELPGLKELDK